MNELRVTTVDLPPMHVASAHGFGRSPEEIAFQKITSFAAANDLLQDGKLPLTYGFNNPGPHPGSPNYGYEVWLPISETIAASGDIKIIDFSGGFYASTRFQGIEHIGETWKQLVNWQERSSYQRGSHQWLEKLLNPSETNAGNLKFELYLPLSR